MIPGFREGAMQMQKGGQYVINIPAEQGYGAQAETNPQTGEEVIPANSDLTFEVELIDFMSHDRFRKPVAGASADDADAAGRRAVAQAPAAPAAT